MSIIKTLKKHFYMFRSLMIILREPLVSQLTSPLRTTHKTKEAAA
jgi:hypothetical protein